MENGCVSGYGKEGSTAGSESPRSSSHDARSEAGAEVFTCNPAHRNRFELASRCVRSPCTPYVRQLRSFRGRGDHHDLGVHSAVLSTHARTKRKELAF